MTTADFQHLHIPTRSVEEGFPNLNTSSTAKNRVINYPAPEDADPTQRMAIIEEAGVLSFWDHPEEDIYSIDDGEAV